MSSYQRRIRAVQVYIQTLEEIVLDANDENAHDTQRFDMRAAKCVQAYLRGELRFEYWVCVFLVVLLCLFAMVKRYTTIKNS